VKKTLAFLGASAWIAAGVAFAQLPILELSAGIHLIRAEVAYTVETRAQGLMFRKHLGANEGMFFVFPQSEPYCMWMKNTLIPLSVAFVDADGNILNILDMEPQTLDTHTSAGPALYAIETNKGWFAAKKVKAGDKVTGLPKQR